MTASFPNTKNLGLLESPPIAPCSLRNWILSPMSTNHEIPQLRLSMPNGSSCDVPTRCPLRWSGRGRSATPSFRACRRCRRQASRRTWWRPRRQAPALRALHLENGEQSLVATETFGLHLNHSLAALSTDARLRMPCTSLLVAPADLESDFVGLGRLRASLFALNRLRHACV